MPYGKNLYFMSFSLYHLHLQASVQMNKGGTKRTIPRERHLQGQGYLSSSAKGAEFPGVNDRAQQTSRDCFWISAQGATKLRQLMSPEPKKWQPTHNSQPHNQRDCKKEKKKKIADLRRSYSMSRFLWLKNYEVKWRPHPEEKAALRFKKRI